MWRHSSLLSPLLLAGMWFCMHISYAGELTLSNGDRIAGEFRGIQGDSVIWLSPHLGELRLTKSAVKGIQSQERFKLRGESSPCELRALVNLNVLFICENGASKNIPLLTLENVVPYVGHVQANHSYSGNLRIKSWKQTGNTESEYWEAATEVRLRHSDWRHIISLTYHSQTTQTRPSGAAAPPVQTRSQRALGAYTLDWFFLPQWYWSNRFSGAKDENRNIQEQYKLSSGLGHQFWETDVSALSFEGGLQHNRTYLMNNPPADDPEAYTSLRLAADYRYQFRGGLNFYHHNEISRSLNQPDANERQRWDLRTDTGLNFPIGFGISANCSAAWNYINHARDLNPNASQVDAVYSIGVNYGW